MKTVYAENHHLHAPMLEFSLGKMNPCFEKPERAQFVHDAVKSRNLGSFIAPREFSAAETLAVHGTGYVEFLKSAYRECVDGGYSGDAFASAFNVQHPGARPPRHIDGKLGFYMADGTVPLTESSWSAIESSAFTALTAQKLLSSNESSAFALCRPPGHHATRNCGAGYCFLNNAAIAAQEFLKDGAKRVAVLDVDYHHGNGTQTIFYGRNDVLFASLHVDPAVDYPYFLGYAEDTGEGAGEGFNLNYPLPYGTDWNSYVPPLKDALKRIASYDPDAVVVSLGVDTFEKDPISRFLLKSADYTRMGAAIAALKKPTLFVLEGGYAVEEIGINVANVLEGFSEV